MLNFIVMQMTKINREKGYFYEVSYRFIISYYSKQVSVISESNLSQLRFRTYPIALEVFLLEIVSIVGATFLITRPQDFLHSNQAIIQRSFFQAAIFVKLHRYCAMIRGSGQFTTISSVFCCLSATFWCELSTKVCKFLFAKLQIVSLFIVTKGFT